MPSLNPADRAALGLLLLIWEPLLILSCVTLAACVLIAAAERRRYGGAPITLVYLGQAVVSGIVLATSANHISQVLSPVLSR